MLYFTFLLSTLKVMIKTLCPIFYVSHYPFNTAFLILIYKNEHGVAISKIYRLVEPGATTTSVVEIECSPCYFTMVDIKCSATNISRSFKTLICSSISLLSDFIATYNQIYSEPTLITVIFLIYKEFRCFIFL